MQTKTYFANSVPAALEVARQELGPDAMLVTSRPAPEHSRHLGRLEVTFAFDQPAPGPAGRSKSELEDIREQLTALRMAIQRGATGAEIPAASSNPVAVPAVTPIAPPLPPAVPIEPFRAMAPGESRVIAFVGPSGRGKTTSLVKIAVRYGLAREAPVRIYSAGAHGVGQQEQMARYAAILGVPWEAYESLENLHLAMNGGSWRGLCLIDTPGLSAADRAELNDFARFFSRRPEIEKHLVLRADSTLADMTHAISRFSALAPGRLLFTGIDEALSTSAAVDALMRSGIAATFVGTGQRIPEDIEEADSARLLAAAREASRPGLRIAAVAA